MPKTVFTGENQIIVAALIEARHKAGLTQVQLAQRIGKDQSWVSLVEGSQRRVDLLEFRAIAQALERDPIELFAEISIKLADSRF